MVGEEGVVTKGLEEAGGGGGCDGGEKREWEGGTYVSTSRQASLEYSPNMLD